MGYIGHTDSRSSTCASPSAAFSSSFSSASARSRWLGSSLPLSARPCLPPSRNRRFQVEIDCSLALPRRAASAVVISPLMTARTSLNLSSTEKTEGRATCSSLHKEPDTNPHARFRDAGHSISRHTLQDHLSPSSRRSASTADANSSRRSVHHWCITLPCTTAPHLSLARLTEVANGWLSQGVVPPRASKT